MPEVADVFRRFGGSYLAAHGAAMLPSHRRAIADIIACRTEALGGQQWCCNDCGALLHVFHSCRNRACPKCHAELPAAVETSIGPAHYPAECTQSDAFLQLSLRARYGRATLIRFLSHSGNEDELMLQSFLNSRVLNGTASPWGAGASP